MKIAAFTENGECGCMADSVIELIDILQDQGAIISEYEFYQIDNVKTFKLGIVEDKS